jgi:hypothetical protein
MIQVLGAFVLMDFTILQPVLTWRVFRNLQTIYIFNFPIFLGRGELRKTENEDTESVDMGAHPYYSIL